MDRRDLDLNVVSRSFNKSPVLITCSGADPTFSVYQHAITSYFMNKEVVWRRNGRDFPHAITFPLKFVPYEDDLCFGPQISAAEITKIAYLHIFIINVNTADDYRTNVRHNVSDWFAKLNSKSDVQWMIFINTTRARDRRTRTAIMDKIKSDFNRYQNKLHELPDTSDNTAFSSFVREIQICLFQHLNLVIEIWDRSLRAAYERKRQHNWDPFAYFTSMSEYGRCHWSFGAIEFSISIFDDLDQLLHEFVLKAREADSPRWLAQLLNIQIEDRPSLVKNIGVQKLQKKEAHYLGMRNYILCQQIVMAIHSYQHKMKSNEAAPSLRSDCAIEILRRTLLCIETVKEFNTQMNNKRDMPMTNCWIWWTVSEAMDICNLLCDISHLDIAPPIISRLDLARFEALHSIAKYVKMNPGDGEKLVEWLKINETAESKLLATAIESVETMASELEKAHDICVSALTHSNRHRNSLHVTNRLFSFLRSCNMNVPTQKVSIKFLKTLPVQSTTAVMLKNLYADDLEAIPRADPEECLSLLLFISQCENGEDQTTNELFLRRCEEVEKPVRWNTISEKNVFDIKLDTFDAVRTTESRFTTKCHVTSKLGFKLKNSRIKLHFSSSLDSNIVHKDDLSVLTLQHDARANVCRLVSELKMRKKAESSNENKLLIESEDFELQPGNNTIELTTKITSVGCFVLEKVSIESLPSRNLYFETTCVYSRKPPVLYCISAPHIVTIINDSQPFLAGVIQKVEIELEAKCDIDTSSHFQIMPSSSSMKFLNKDTLSWSDDISISIEPMKSLQKVVLEVFLSLKIDKTICESAAVQKRVLNFEWMKRKYSHPINFVPIMVFSSKTSRLITDILLEVELNRAAGEHITSIVTEAKLYAVDTANKEDVPAEFLTKLPISCEMMSIVNFVWKLPLNGSAVKHRLFMNYTVKNNLDSDFTDEERQKLEALIYSYEDTVEYSVPEIKLEICTQVLSQQPGAQLCRALSPCHFVISIRCLKDMPCTLYVVLNADDRMWTLSERTKIVAIKESGLGQLALSIVPVIAGYLPFPSVSIYDSQQTYARVCEEMFGCMKLMCAARQGEENAGGSGPWCGVARQNSPVRDDANSNEPAPGHSDTITPVGGLLCFNRTAGKQIRVLSANNSDNNNTFAKDDNARGSNRIAKKIGKLFD